MTWALVWKFARTFWGGVVIGALGLLAAQVLWSARSTSAPSPTPYTAEPTKRAAAADKALEDLSVQTLKPEPKDRAKMAADYRQPGILAPVASNDVEKQANSENGPGNIRSPGKYSPLSEKFSKEILSEVKFTPLPDGGTALTTLDRATGQVETIVRPLPEPRISFANRWRVLGAYGQFEDREPIIRAQVEWWPVKIRRLELGAAAGWERTDRGRAYVLAQVAVVPR